MPVLRFEAPAGLSSGSRVVGLRGSDAVADSAGLDLGWLRRAQRETGLSPYQECDRWEAATWSDLCRSRHARD